VWYSYAIVRIVPRVERGECLNVGVVLFARERQYLSARLELDLERLQAFSPGADPALIQRHLDVFKGICAGDPRSGPIAGLPPPERFHWLTTPRSTVLQTSPVHAGLTDDPESAIDEIFDRLVRLPRDEQMDGNHSVLGRDRSHPSKGSFVNEQLR
jgi:hypothetical protein